ncbi:MAG: RNA polymerase factor sigma-32 [Rhodospirillaceae bacterium]|nr:RNA polymerase factor sigma-32 [Rhodospirillaceae bacterium]MBT6137431.1 RNA polymerase factor sigma-32 [Rhodospirillaceae bacterium]
MGYADQGLAEQATRGFIKTTMKAPLLTREHELDLARRWRDDEDEAALHELVQAYMRLVVSLAVKFRNYGLPMSDLIQEGNIGLMQAAARFEPEREVRFSTYAVWWIRSAIQDYVLRNWSIVRIGTTATQKSLFFNLRRLQARIGVASAPQDRRPGEADDTIAEQLRVGVHDVEKMRLRLSGSDQSLNATVGEDGDEEWQEFLADERPNPEETTTVLRAGNTRTEWLAEALMELSPRERTIIECRRLTEEGATLEALGRQLGVSKERVRQIESRALGKLRDCISRRIDDPSDLYSAV